MVISNDFITRTKALFGEERYAVFADALNEEPRVSIRYNSAKKADDDALFAADMLSQVPWASQGRYLSSRPLFTADPLFHAGCYYVQEASSMFLEQVVKQFVSEPVRALDLCAAPGGKSTHLHSLLPKGSLLVSNEPMPLRAQVLAENVAKWGNPAAVVTKNYPAEFSGFRDFFDFMVVDAPCSGEGMFRKDSFAVEQWNTSLVEQCSKRQKEILSDIWGSLRPGGILVYSTCTFNSEENEKNVHWVVEELGATPLEVEISKEWGVTRALDGSDIPVYRFIPGFTAGEGFFLAVLRKDGDGKIQQPRQPRFQQASAKVVKDVEKWISESNAYDYVLQNDVITALPKEHTAAIMALQQKMNVLHCGIPLATVKNNKLLPMHQLAISNALAKDAFNRASVDLDTALAFLHRETLALPEAPVGYIILEYKGVPLGFVKNIGNRANNLYPAEWRIRKNPIDLKLK